MRDDLRDAHAAVEWARSQLPIVEQEIECWLKSSPYSIVEDLHAEMGTKFFRLRVNRELPGAVNAGVEAIISSVRSSLDLLASALAARHGALVSSGYHFPIYATIEEFLDPENAAQREQRLSAAERQIVEELKPYRGGNEFLFALHQLDSWRKRERLIDVHVVPGAVMHTTGAEAAGYRLAAKWPGFEDGAVLGGANINAPTGGFDIEVAVKFIRADLVPPQPVIATLGQFVRLADEIIKRFDIG